MNKIDVFLNPIAENNSCGKFFRYDHLYDQIQEHKREDDSDLSQGIWQTELKRANWSEVEKLCAEALKTKTKDIQIAVWLTEAWTILRGFDGLNDGILLISALCEKFWDNIHPKIIDGNMTPRLSPIYYFADKISDRIKLIYITNPQDSTLDSFCLADWMLARHNLKIKNTNGLSLKQIHKSIITTSFDFFYELKNNVESIIENVNKLDDVITSKCGKNAPSFGNILSALRDIQRITQKNLSEVQPVKIVKEEANITQVENSTEPEEEENNKPKDNHANEPTIEQAYDALAGIAEFLEKNQPQSPACILIKIAYKIGKKTFQELLETDVNCNSSIIGTISELYKLLWENNDKH